MNVRVDLNTPIADGTEVVFRSPVDCSQVTGLKVYYQGGSQEFAFADAHGNNVGDIDHLFAENVVVKVILDPAHSMAFVQNADTNAYLEGRFQRIEDRLGNETTGSVFIGDENTTLEEFYDAHCTGKMCFMKRNMAGGRTAYWAAYTMSSVMAKFYEFSSTPDGQVSISYATLDSSGNFTSKSVMPADKAYVDEAVGDIETALDAIIAIQNQVLGGDSV